MLWSVEMPRYIWAGVICRRLNHPRAAILMETSLEVSFSLTKHPRDTQNFF